MPGDGGDHDHPVAPHWGCTMVFWKHYAEFWLRALDLVTPFES